MAGQNGGFARDPVALVLGISIATGPVGACHPAPASTAPASPSPSPSPSQLQAQPVPTPKVGQHRTG